MGRAGVILVIPVEVKSRELEARTLLALVAADHGFRVILGDAVRLRAAISAGAVPPGILFDKCISRGKEDRLRIARKKGLRIVSCDEEGGNCCDLDEFVAARSSASTVQLSRAVFAWGGEDAAAWRRHHPGLRVVETGSPRVDFWRSDLAGYYREEVDRIRARFGRFVLAASNFTVSSRKSVDDIVAYERKVGAVTTQEDEARLRDALEGNRREGLRFAGIVNDLGRRVILRPHPSETPDVWRGLVDEVVQEGSVGAWIRASEGVLHSGSTVALEAYAAGVPTVTTNPSSDLLADRVSSSLAEGFVSKPGGMLDGRYANLKGPLAARRIARDLRAMAVSGPGWETIENAFRTRRMRIHRKANQFGVGRLGALHKFPGLHESEIETIARRLGMACEVRPLHPHIVGIG